MYIDKNNSEIQLKSIKDDGELYILQYDYNKIDLSSVTEIYHNIQRTLDKPVIALPVNTALVSENITDIIMYRDSINKMIKELEQNFHNLFEQGELNGSKD